MEDAYDSSFEAEDSLQCTKPKENTSEQGPGDADEERSGNVAKDLHVNLR